MIVIDRKKSPGVTFCTLLAIVLALSGETAVGQNCGCPPNLCCSKWGYCGLGDPFCGEGCQSGPCDQTTGNCGCPPNLCCSKWGYCGLGDAYCGEGCQSGPCDQTTGNCGCPPNLCCSKWGYCGLEDPFCGEGCQSGPCYDQPTGNISVADVVTEEFFNGIASHAGPNCPGKKFYSRTVFLQALGPYPRFASGPNDVAKREIAAFFAHVTHETGSLCYIEEINGASYDYCDPSNKQYPCVPGKKYFGRGPIQLSWNYNYGAAGQSIGFDGLNDPDIVARDPLISFETALWFWMNSNCHTAITSGQGFGATIRAINGMECDGGNPAAVNSRVQYYINYCNQFGVEPGANLYCNGGNLATVRSE